MDGVLWMGHSSPFPTTHTGMGKVILTENVTIRSTYRCLFHCCPFSHVADNKQIVSLPNLHIIDFSYGHTGSTHDSSAWEDTCVFQGHENLLEDGEWVCADSAYPVKHLSDICKFILIVVIQDK